MQESFDVVSASLDLLNEVLSKFGGLVASEHARLRNALLPELDESRAGVRKRAIHCLSAPLAQHRAGPHVQQSSKAGPSVGPVQARWRRT